jgi:hypothetical protein
MPTYETKLDRENEMIVAEAVGKYLKADLRSNPRFAPADFLTDTGNIQVEIRCRNCRKDKYPNIIISATKWIELLRLKVSDKKPTVYFTVCWTDYLGILEVDFELIEPIPFKRNKSAGNHQNDVMISLPIQAFKIIGPSPKLTKTQNWID